MSDIDAIVTLAREALDAGAEADKYKRERDLLRTRISNLEREVVKLRELVHDLSICAANTWVDYFDCDECPLNDKHDCDFDRRRQELGIEIKVER